jgi:hypothetical protein
MNHIQKLCRSTALRLISDSSTRKLVIAGAGVKNRKFFTLVACPSSETEAKLFLTAVNAIFRANSIENWAMAGPKSFYSGHGPIVIIEGESGLIPSAAITELKLQHGQAVLDETTTTILPSDNPLNLLKPPTVLYKVAVAFLKRCKAIPNRFVVLGGPFGDDDWIETPQGRGHTGKRVAPTRAVRWL